MSELLPWSPLASTWWNTPLDLLRRSPFPFVDSLQKMLDITPEKASIRVEEFVDGNTLVVRAELPGSDPEKDVSVEVDNGMLHIRAHREEKEEERKEGQYRSEFHYGSFERTLALPEDVKEEDIKASFKDGVLEVRATLPEKAVSAQPTKVQITRA